MRGAALQALERYETPRVAAMILDRYPKMPAALQDRARDVLVSRSSWSTALLAAVTAARVPAKDFRLEQVRRILLHGDGKLTQGVEKLWGRVRPASSREKQGRILAVSQILAVPSSLEVTTFVSFGLNDRPVTGAVWPLNTTSSLPCES